MITASLPLKEEVQRAFARATKWGRGSLDRFRQTLLRPKNARQKTPSPSSGTDSGGTRSQELEDARKIEKDCENFVSANR